MGNKSINTPGRAPHCWRCLGFLADQSATLHTSGFFIAGLSDVGLETKAGATMLCGILWSIYGQSMVNLWIIYG